MAELALVAALAGAYIGLGFGDTVQVANGALVVLIGIPLRWVATIGMRVLGVARRVSRRSALVPQSAPVPLTVV